MIVKGIIFHFFLAIFEWIHIKIPVALCLIYPDFTLCKLCCLIDIYLLSMIVAFMSSSMILTVTCYSINSDIYYLWYVWYLFINSYIYHTIIHLVYRCYIYTYATDFLCFAIDGFIFLLTLGIFTLPTNGHMLSDPYGSY
jgi:hypothetical protein